MLVVLGLYEQLDCTRQIPQLPNKQHSTPPDTTHAIFGPCTSRPTTLVTVVDPVIFDIVNSDTVMLRLAVKHVAPIDI